MSELKPEGSGKTTKKKTSKKTQSKSKEERAKEMFEKEQAENQQEVKRRFKGDKTVYHDLIKLDVANVEKNVSWNDEKPLWEPMPHKHFYHTVDSDGKPQKYCTPSLGHTHEMVFKGVDENGHPVYEPGPAVVLVGGKPKQPRSDKMQNHKEHACVYMQSDEIKVRKYSSDFIKAQNEKEAEMHQALKAPEGVQS